MSKDNCELCDCCDNCADCALGAPITVSLNIDPYDVPCFPSECRIPATGFSSFPGSKTVKSCPNTSGFGKEDCSAKYNTSGRIGIRIRNQSSKCIVVQFYFNISGIAQSDDCTLEGSMNCGTAFDYGANGTEVFWFYVCLSPGQDETVWMNHRIKGCAYPCCFNEATIDNFKYAVRCVHDTDCPYEDCPSTGCPGCCQCCCFDIYGGTFFIVDGGSKQPCASASMIIGCDIDGGCSPSYLCSSLDEECCTATCASLDTAVGFDCNGPCDFPLVLESSDCGCHCTAPFGPLECNPDTWPPVVHCYYEPSLEDFDCQEFDSFDRCSYL